MGFLKEIEGKIKNQHFPDFSFEKGVIFFGERGYYS
jgi:hypothetical protein